jgi:hypothetical protein
LTKFPVLNTSVRTLSISLLFEKIDYKYFQLALRFLANR